MAVKHIKIVDTTLRDGEQMPGVNLNVSDKLRIAHALSKLGADVIEAGFPASSISDFQAVKKISEQISTTEISALSRADIDDIDKAYEALLPASKKRIHIFIASSDIHLKYKLKITREQLLEKVAQAVSYGKSKFDYVQFSPEDATRSDPEFLKRVIEVSIENGADMINIPDTVGYSNPKEFGDLIRKIKNDINNIRKIDLSVHCHNDLGMAVANSLSAVENGAEWIECTVNGIGERAGNTSLEEIVMALNTRHTYYNAKTSINSVLLYKTSNIVSSITGVYIPLNKAIVGKNIFVHESGIHQHGVIENPRTYEIMTPQSIGINESTILLGKHSGRHAFDEKLEELGFKLEKPISEAAFKAFKNLASRKKIITDEDIKAIAEDSLLDASVIGGYELQSYQIQSGNNIKSMTLVVLQKNGELLSEAAVGTGPIDASFNAINRIINYDYNLVHYNIKAVTGGTDALGEVRVIISDNQHEYVGKGISTDIIESSIKAYINAVNRININKIKNINGGIL